jgi:outer membrane protein assembly factor BamB
MPAAVVGDVLVVSDETTTSALDMATGRFLWTMPVRGSVMATDGARILLDGGTVLRIDDGGVVVPSPALAGAVPLGRTVHLVTAELIDVEEGTEALTLLGW